MNFPHHLFHNLYLCILGVVAILVEKKFIVRDGKSRKVHLYLRDRSNFLEVQAIISLNEGRLQLLRDLQVGQVLEVFKIVWDSSWHVATLMPYSTVRQVSDLFIKPYSLLFDRCSVMIIKKVWFSTECLIYNCNVR